MDKQKQKAVPACEADLRLAVPPEDATPDDLWERGHSFVKAVLDGAGTGKPAKPEDA